jgi:hypothetical protein
MLKRENVNSCLLYGTVDFSQESTMALISTKTHGTLDYMTGAAIAALPGFLKCGSAAKAIFELVGAGAAVYSMFTNYERGIVKALPMEAHLAMDAASGAALMAASVMLTDERPEVRCAMGCVGLFEVAVASLTSPRVGEPEAEPAAQQVAVRLVDYVRG